MGKFIAFEKLDCNLQSIVNMFSEREFDEEKYLYDELLQ
jgi:hypothetical protein